MWRWRSAIGPARPDPDAVTRDNDHPEDTVEARRKGILTALVNTAAPRMDAVLPSPVCVYSTDE